MKQWVNTKIDSVKEYYIRPRKIALACALIVFIGLLTLWLYVGSLARKRLLLEERLQVANNLNTIGTSLTMAVNQRLYLITSLRSFVEAEIIRDNGFSFDILEEKGEFDHYSAGLFSSVPGIRNIAIAPDGVMQYVYPYEENKAVLGYEPAQDERPHVRDEVQRAIENKRIVLSLPYDLIQGGQGLIARQAIYVNGIYWGLANVVLDVPPLLEDAGIFPVSDGLELAIADQSGVFFFGSDGIIKKEPVTYEVTLPEGVWSLMAVPVEGWGIHYRSMMWIYNVLGLVATITIPLVVYLSVNRQERLTHIVEQRTKELKQSNQTLITVLEGIDADVYVADFETHEVLFANKHLRESFNDSLVGKICYEVFRKESTICSHCKNRFLLDSDGQPADVQVWEGKNPITKRWYKNADRAIRWRGGRYVHLQIATDITELKQAADKIRESEERYRTLFDSVPVGIYRSTPDGYFLDGNPALIKILGYPDQKTMLSANINYLYLDKSDREEELGLIEQVDLVNNHRLQLKRYDGSFIWVQDSANAIRNSSGETLYYYGKLEDITERVRAEQTLLEAELELKALLQEKEILLAEVHHRVKNNMQVIISLLNLQASGIEDENLQKVYEESRNRIKSMTLVHEQLYRSREYARIGIGEYIDQLATTLFSTYEVDQRRVQLHIEAENIFIDLERAIPCGLLLNELITNSLKYAFPDGRKGQIWIQFRPDGDHIILDYRDDGVGLPVDLNLENAQSLGMQLVHLLTIHDLQGSLKFENGGKQGVQFFISFPLS